MILKHFGTEVAIHRTLCIIRILEMTIRKCEQIKNEKLETFKLTRQYLAAGLPVNAEF